MKIAELRQMTLDDLKVRLDQSSDEIFKLKFRLVTQPLDDPLRIRRIRKDIARIKTLMRERELGGVASNAPSAGAPASPAAKPVRAKAVKAAAKKSAVKSATKSAKKSTAKAVKKSASKSAKKSAAKKSAAGRG
jgi:large subunit ribosomal protein L29